MLQHTSRGGRVGILREEARRRYWNVVMVGMVLVQWQVVQVGKGWRGHESVLPLWRTGDGGGR